MSKRRSWRWLSVACLGLALPAVTGCQTWFPEAGLTLPTGFYLLHPAQYFPPTPDYPLPRELANLQDAAAQQAAPPAPGPLIPGAGPGGGP